MDLAPSTIVLKDFGALGNPERVLGGQGTSWRCGSLILKPLDMPIEALEWLDIIVRPLSDNQTGTLRLSLPQQARSGGFVVDGWTAFPILDGAHLSHRWLDIIEISNDFSKLLDTLEPPSFIRGRHDLWAIADRAAWGEQTVDGLSRVPHVTRLFSMMRPVSGRAQLIHGDLAGNVLFHPTLPPAVIDLTFYWRPKAYAAAIIVVDALCFEQAEHNLLDLAGERHLNIIGQDDFAQYLLRALVFRIATDFLRGEDKKLGSIEDPYTLTVEMVCFRAEKCSEPDRSHSGSR